MARMTAEMQKILRAPFPPEQIGKLPRITCANCRDAQGRVCGRHTKTQCRICKNYVTDAHTHLDYVGHAAVTDRLLQADPEWTWAPAYRQVDPAVLVAAAGNPDSFVIIDQVLDNAPPLTTKTGMWIRLTVGGVTRLGFGTDDDPGPDHEKKLVSDAIRNAAMRFGVGLDLWSKGDLSGDPEASEPGRPRPRLTVVPPPVSESGRDWIAEGKAATTVDQVLLLGRECSQAGEFLGDVKDALIARRAELSTPTKKRAASS